MLQGSNVKGGVAICIFGVRQLRVALARGAEELYRRRLLPACREMKRRVARLVTCASVQVGAAIYQQAHAIDSAVDGG
jgi:hypothetical protein